MKKAAGQQPFQSLPVILKERGYTSSFIYGGDIEFDNMKGFLINNGVENFISIKDFKNEELEGKWGAKDEFLFSKAAEFLDKQPEPFFSIIMTLSNHEPFDGIDKKFQKFSEKDHKEWKYLNAYYYSDYALGEFFRKIENKKFAKNTIFIMVADHGKNLKRNVDIDWRRFHIPCLIYTPSNILKPAKINKVASQTDILPTVMNLLGGDYISASWGQNLFQDNNKNFAHFIQDKTIGVISDNFLLVDNLYSEPKLFALSDLDCKNNLSDSLIQVKEEMKKISRIILQISEKQVKTRALGK